MEIWGSLGSFGTFCIHLVHFFSFGLIYREKSGNPDQQLAFSGKSMIGIFFSLTSKAARLRI
jgi:hypothetical protein